MPKSLLSLVAVALLGACLFLGWLGDVGLQSAPVPGLSSKREITRTSIRVRTAMAVQMRAQGRYLGGRPP